MRNRGTWVFLGLVVALGIYTAWDIQIEKKEEERKTKESVLVNFPSDQVQKVNIATGSTKIELNKTVDGWQVVAPFSDSADNSVVEEMIGGMTQSKAQFVVAEGEGIDWNIYGISSQSPEITLTHQNNEKVIFILGAKKSYDGHSYLRKKDAQQVLMTSTDWSVWANKKPTDFRDHRLFRGRIGSVTHIKFKNQQGSFELAQIENKWMASGKTGWNIDPQRVQEILTQISEARALETIIEKSISKTDKSKYGLEKPETVISLKRGDQLWSAELYQNSKKEIYAIVSDPVFLLKLDSTFYERARNLKVGSLRNKKEVFDFNKDLVKEMEFQTPLKRQILTLKEMKWVMTPEDSQFEVQQDLSSGLLDSLKAIDLLEFAEKGTLKPENRILLKEANAKTVFELIWGPYQKMKFNDVEKNVVLAKTNLSQDNFYLDQSEIEKLRLLEMIKSKEVKK